MSWFDTTGITTLAKTALKEAQKTIDKALDIQEEDSDEPEVLKSKESVTNKSDFFSSWGLTVSGESEQDEQNSEQHIITESPSKSHTLWGSFAGSFFDSSKLIKEELTDEISQGYSDSAEILQETNESVLSTNKLDTSQARMSENNEDSVKEKALNRLSIISSENENNSSESVEVLGSHKTTPDSEITPTLSNSSSLGLKVLSDSVEILPDSLISPSSIEFLGDDYSSSDIINNEYTSTNLFVGEDCDKGKQELSAKIPTESSNDSISLVNEADEDTISYNSESECTAPTVLDTEDKPISHQPTRSDGIQIKKTESKDIHAEKVHSNMSKVVEKISESYASSDGSWSDKTLVVEDSKESILDLTLEDNSKADNTILQFDGDKNSDSSSFCNINQGDMCSSMSDHASTSEFITVCKEPKMSCETSSSNKDSRRGSPLSSESCSGLVKIGSDRTSGHTSGDDIETATSSDIEVIPSPNSEQHFRPSKEVVRGKADRATSPNLVDYVLEKSVITKVRGHNRELSETSVASNASEESGSETEKLFKRLCEMAEVLQAREAKLIEISKHNAELLEVNEDLKSKLEGVTSRQDAGDIAEDYNMRMSALEKKFQQTLREKDALKKQMETLKSNASFEKELNQFTTELKEKDEIIKQMHEEGEKLAKQQLAQSNIIKKLRSKDKESEQLMKSLRDRIADQNQELERLKRTLVSKDEIEAAQIETVYKLTNANKKLETDYAEARSALDDTTQKLVACRTSLDAAESMRDSNLYKKKKDALAAQEKLESENEQLKQQLENLRAKFVQEESRWARREANLRSELADARALCSGDDESNEHASALVQQLHALQYSALERDKQHRAHSEKLSKALHEAQYKLSQVFDTEKSLREEIEGLRSRLEMSDIQEQRLNDEYQKIKDENARYFKDVRALEEQLNMVSSKLEQSKLESSGLIHELRDKLKKTEALLNQEKALCEVEKRKNLFLQEQLNNRYDRSQGHSPPISIANSDSLSLPYPQDDSMDILGHQTSHGGGSNSIAAMENLSSLLARREGELKASCSRVKELQREKDALTAELAEVTHQLQQLQSIREQYDALLVLYGERAEQAEELALDLQDVKDLYKSQLDEIIALKRQLAESMGPRLS